MAFFTDKSKTPTKSPTADPLNPFAFDIDEQGHSSASRQRQQLIGDTSMINHGQHCSLEICGQLDILPSTCDYCSAIFCRAHIHAEKHDCPEYLSDLTTSPLCEKCNEYIKIPIERTTNRTIYNQVIAEHVNSNCVLHSFKRSVEERRLLKEQLRCFASGCTNHVNAKLSTMICKDCNQQVCLSHRLGDYHNCAGLAKKLEQFKKERGEKDQLKEKVLEKLYGKLSSDDNTNSTTQQLKQIQQQVHSRAKEQCKNPYVANRQAQQQAQVAAQLQVQELKRQQSMQDEVQFIPQSVTTIPSYGTLVVHEQVNLVNVKTLLMQIKSKCKNPAATTIPNENKVYTVVYFPQTTIAPNAPSTTEPSIPFSTQDNLLTFNQHIYQNDVMTLLKEENPDTSLLTTNVYLPQCLGDFSLHANASLLEKNTKLMQPQYICLDNRWSIKQCIDEITKASNLQPYDNLSKSSHGKTLYTLAMLSFPIANFKPSLTLSDIIKQYEFDFNLETEMIQEEVSILTNKNTFNNKATASTKSATHRLNTVFAPLHLSFGWYIDTSK